MGQVFYDMGILGSAEVIECSASDLVGQYVGQTGPKTKKLFEKALGKVLFVDEAYRLGQGHFAQEAIDELVGLITQPTFKSKLIIILAGYEQDMNSLMSVNAGLSSRFPDQVVFHNIGAQDCLKIVLNEMTKKKIRFSELEDESSAVYEKMKGLVEDLASLPDWGNARDMVTLSTALISKALLLDSNTGADIQLASSAALGILEKMVADRERRSKIPLKKSRVHPTLPASEQTFTSDPPPPPSISTEATVAKPETPLRSFTPASQSRGVTRRGRGRGRGGSTFPSRDPLPSPSISTEATVARPETSSHSSGQTFQGVRGVAPRGRGRGGHQAIKQVQRDPNVSDEVWNALQAAIRAKDQKDRDARDAIKALEQRIKENRKNEEARAEELKSLQKKAEAKEANERAAILKETETARLREQGARRARERAAAELQAKKEEERRQKEQEEKAQRKLRELGVCSAGFRWYPMGDGYRCEGGFHFVSASQLGL